MKIKIIFLVQFLIVFTRIGYAQNLSGKYSYSQEHGSRTISFENGHFYDEKKDGAFFLIGKGTFELKDSLLSMTYEQIKNRNSSPYTLNSTLNKTKITHVSLQLNYEDGTPAQALVAIFDSDNNRLITYTVDSLGKYSFTIDPKFDSESLSIVQIPYYTIEIPVKQLKNKSSSIKATLKESRLTYRRPEKITYVIGKNEKGVLILKSQENNNKLVLKKIEK